MKLDLLTVVAAEKKTLETSCVKQIRSHLLPDT
jgi:hypothetical protein